MLGAMLACRFGLHRAGGPLGQRVGKELLAAGAKPGLFAGKFFQVMGFQVEILKFRRPGVLAMITAKVAEAQTATQSEAFSRISRLAAVQSVA